jgi:hypothetical protein
MTDSAVAMQTKQLPHLSRVVIVVDGKSTVRARRLSTDGACAVLLVQHFLVLAGL